MAQVTRRDFFRTSLAGTLLAATGGVTAWAQKRSAADWVTLGNSGVKVTRLAFGTGTFSGRVQRDLGQDGFTRLVRYAYDHGIRFFETAEGYRGMPQMLAAALQGLPRDSYRLMTKFGASPNTDVPAKIESLRQALNTEYIDIVLMHCLRSPQWPDQTKTVQDGLSEAKRKKLVLAHGASVHGLQALAAFPGNQWLDVALLRVNHAGVRMDTPDLRDTDALGDVDQVVSQARKIHAQGTGVLGMKLVGESQFTQPEQREAAMNFVMKLGAVDAVTIGYKSPAEIDEAIERMNRALNA
jgi:aryl-alcohol dehydrogenase-like predicted oxidoreductase